MSQNSDFTLERRTPPPIEVEGTGAICLRIQTSLGDIVCRLFESRTPNTVRNVVALAQGRMTEAPYYEGLQFHRVVPQFIIHGGAANDDGTGGPEYAIEHETANIPHEREGLLTMFYAHRDCGGAQFMITAGPAPWLDRNHTAFGEVIEGLSVVHKISRVPTDGHNRPLEPVVINGVDVFRQP